jgi:hypothetical protein
MVRGRQKMGNGVCPSCENESNAICLRLAIVSGVDFCEVSLVRWQLVERIDCFVFTDRDTRSAVQATLRINKKLLYGLVIGVFLAGANVLTLTNAHALHVLGAQIYDYAWHFLK